MTQQDNDGAFGDLFLDEGWYGVTTPGADLRTVRPLYAILPDGQMRVARLTPEEEAAQEARDPFERDPNPLADESAGESVAELVRVAYGYVVAREPLAVESPEAFAGPLPVAPILVVAALRSVGGAFHSPCIQAVTPLIAPPESLTRCAGWSQGIQTVSMLLSPALASVLYAHVPLAWILLLDTLGAVFAIGGVLLARLPVLRAGEHGAPLRLWQDTREGLAVLRSHRWLWELTLICALFSVAFLPVSALFPLMSMDYFGGDSASAALVETLFSAGMLLGSVILGLWGGTRDKILTMTAAVLGLGLTLVLSGLLPPGGFWAFAALSGLMGLSAPFFNSVFMALIQTRVEPEYLGRVLGLTGAIMTLASPVGLGLTALFAGAAGLTVWFLLSGVVTLACGGLMLLLPAVRTCSR